MTLLRPLYRPAAAAYNPHLLGLARPVLRMTTSDPVLLRAAHQAILMAMASGFLQGPDSDDISPGWSDNIPVHHDPPFVWRQYETGPEQ